MTTPMIKAYQLTRSPWGVDGAVLTMERWLLGPAGSTKVHYTTQPSFVYVKMFQNKRITQRFCKGT